MKLYAFTLAFMSAETVEASLNQFLKTAGDVRPNRWLIAPHHWPLDRDQHEAQVTELAKLVEAEVKNPEKNLGGTAGANWLIHQLNPEPDDFVLWYDADSFPLTTGWLPAMLKVMEADPEMATLSLWPPGQMGADWEETTLGGHRVRRYAHTAQMFSVTLWRASFALPKIDAHHEFYGQIEGPAFLKAWKHGMYNAWLPDFIEGVNPVPHPEIYTRWKQEHVAGVFHGNFDAYLLAQARDRDELGGRS